jgi:hypothetical protein
MFVIHDSDIAKMQNEIKDEVNPEKSLLGKRANRGYNPKYDKHSTEFVCGENDKIDVAQEQLAEKVQEAKVVRKVGRPPKDKSLINLKKQE